MRYILVLSNNKRQPLFKIYTIMYLILVLFRTYTLYTVDIIMLSIEKFITRNYKYTYCTIILWIQRILYKRINEYV